ncbi:hypothetical protein HAX54_036508 [Datura stramonium]|uniref:Uncharacterized protein n=1 Tax=Datura stramonium TaxID=4076 RepID=A0ABS8VJB7_DATST|nr:hypothetical protein [Datura stramonium]
MGCYTQSFKEGEKEKKGPNPVVRRERKSTSEVIALDVSPEELGLQLLAQRVQIPDTLYPEVAILFYEMENVKHARYCTWAPMVLITPNSRSTAGIRQAMPSQFSPGVLDPIWYQTMVLKILYKVIFISILVVVLNYLNFAISLKDYRRVDKFTTKCLMNDCAHAAAKASVLVAESLQ